MSYKFSTFINSYNTECHIHYSGIIEIYDYKSYVNFAFQ